MISDEMASAGDERGADHRRHAARRDPDPRPRARAESPTAPRPAPATSTTASRSGAARAPTRSRSTARTPASRACWTVTCAQHRPRRRRRHRRPRRRRGRLLRARHAGRVRQPPAPGRPTCGSATCRCPPTPSRVRRRRARRPRAATSSTTPPTRSACSTPTCSTSGPRRVHPLLPRDRDRRRDGDAVRVAGDRVTAYVNGVAATGTVTRGDEGFVLQAALPNPRPPEPRRRHPALPRRLRPVRRRAPRLARPHPLRHRPRPRRGPREPRAHPHARLRPLPLPPAGAHRLRRPLRPRRRRLRPPLRLRWRHLRLDPVFDPPCSGFCLAAPVRRSAPSSAPRSCSTSSTSA